MRNEAEYPITNGEILGAMDRAIIDSKVKNAGCIPDMTTYLLTIAKGVVERGLRNEAGVRYLPGYVTLPGRRLYDFWINNKGADDRT